MLMFEHPNNYQSPNMNADKLTRDFWKTKAHLYSATLGAAGWNANIADAEIASWPQVFLYIFDRPTEFTWMVSISLDTFAKLSFNASKDIKNIQAVRDGLQHIIFGSAGDGEQTPSQNRDGVWVV